jgi:hypothetical protein
MGIRIHKVLGYGFLRCKFEKDPRFNDHVFNYKHPEYIEGDIRPRLIKYLEEKVKSPDEGRDNFEYKLELSALKRIGMYDNLKDESISLTDVIRCNDMESTGIGPVIFTIPYNKDWHRYDDIIDYVEETQKPVNQEGCLDNVQLITDCEGQPSGIYPYNVGFINRNTGKQIIDTAGNRWFLTRTLREQGVKELKKDNKWGFKTLVEWQRHVVPKLPYFIDFFCDCFNIFKDPKTKYRLRPMIFTYWS